MRRRDFITLVGGTAAWPLAARAQQPAMPVVGFLHGGSPGPSEPFVVAFQKGLSEAGFVQGRSVEIEYRWAEDQYGRLSAMAADLVRRRVALIVAGAPTAAPLAAKVQTTTIPIVFFSGSDPVRAGLVASYNKPGGNATGVASISAELETKRLGILHELAPTATTVAYIVASWEQIRIAEVQTAARNLGKHLLVLKATTETELDDAFATVVQQRAGAVLVGTFAFLSQKGDHLAALASRFAVPTISFNREFAASGGLTSYGTSRSEAWRQIGIYAGRILKGERPADLPVVIPTKFEFIINLQAAKALGLAVPPTLLALADEVIE